MTRLFRIASALLPALALAACAGPSKPRLIDPFPLRFPLVEAGTLEIEGRLAGQPRAQDGVVQFGTSDGFLTAVVVPTGAVLRRSRTVGPGPSPAASAGGISYRRGSGFLRRVDSAGRALWELRVDGDVPADPVQAGDRLYFGDSSRMFYCLEAGTGKVKWRRRLQGAALHPAVVAGGTIALAASNSVVYFLSKRGGSVLSWESVPSRIVHGLAPAGRLVLVSSASPSVLALDIETGRRMGLYEASGPLAAGAVWSPPYVVLFVEDPESGRQRILFLRSR